jgi:hypothetical protein
MADEASTPTTTFELKESEFIKVFERGIFESQCEEIVLNYVESRLNFFGVGIATSTRDERVCNIDYEKSQIDNDGNSLSRMQMYSLQRTIRLVMAIRVDVAKCPSGKTTVTLADSLCEEFFTKAKSALLSHEEAPLPSISLSGFSVHAEFDDVSNERCEYTVHVSAYASPSVCLDRPPKMLSRSTLSGVETLTFFS